MTRPGREDSPRGGRLVQVPLAKVEELGAEAAFTAATGYPETCIVHHTIDEAYDAEGNLIPEDGYGPRR